ncbi:MAG: DUF4293 domain-containing protein [Bacteroidia bacterium]
MLQRIQSVYLSLAALLNLGSLFLPTWTFQKDMGETINGMGIDAGTGHQSLTEHPLHLVWVLLTVSVSAFIFYVIFQYKDHKRQIFLCNLVGILAILQIALTVIFSYMGPYIVLSGSDVKETPGMGFFLLPVVLLLLMLGRKGIQKDWNLLKSVDRIR